MSSLLVHLFSHSWPLICTFIPDVLALLVCTYKTSVCLKATNTAQPTHTHTHKIYSNLTANEETIIFQSSTSTYYLSPVFFFFLCIICRLISNRQNVPDHFWTNAHKHRWWKKTCTENVKVRMKRERETIFGKLVFLQFMLKQKK